ncbi:hypothetical protein [Paeniglutamicibacter gangotriensis]|uniref:Uncharacterized protein n=1 Tax=Paeniglutamicibacter gangotriensis Lz1y TaxID=1276920 RepID=M7MTS4_9MICC|nr:hypothetical protein [Paeniglutamicibacter gangotriensis]EMQ98330.1 hypothetical protein ADIAG_02348 [Paeniglutamicibacter gangotriensis Lz1y]
MADLDPQEAIDLEKYDDPNPEPITDPKHPDYVEPAKGIAPIGGK